jgi:hypothetical protein
MSPLDLLGSLQRRGVVLVPTGDGRLRYHPREALSADERAEIARYRDLIVERFNADPVAWRVAVMATQFPAQGAIPLLLARPGARFPLGTCCSCGDDLTSNDRFRCRPCVEAVVKVLAGRPTHA